MTMEAVSNSGKRHVSLLEKLEPSPVLRESSGSPEMNWEPCDTLPLAEVNFALGKATVRCISKFKFYDGLIYLVEDVETKRLDFVGEEWMKFIEENRGIDV